MKKLFLFAAITSAMIVSCSQDELALIEKTENTPVDLNERISLGNVKFGVARDVTRGIVGDNGYGMKWAPNDRVGAVLVDSVNHSTKGIGWDAEAEDWDEDIEVSYNEYVGGELVQNASTFYDITNCQIFSNYGYTLDNSGWFTSEASLVEGNYVFYAPFNSALQTRGPIKVVFPQYQNASATETSEYAYKNKNNKKTVSTTALSEFYAGTTKNYKNAVSHITGTFLGQTGTEDGITPEVTLYPIYATPMITIDYPSTGVRLAESCDNATPTSVWTDDITIEEIVLYFDGTDLEDEEENFENPLFLSAYIDNSQTAKIRNGQEDEIWGRFATNKGEEFGFTSQVLIQNEECGGEYPIDQPDNEILVDSREDPTWHPVSKEAVDNKLPKNSVVCKVHETISKGTMYHFNAIMPAGKYGKTGLKAKVYFTANGKRYMITEATYYDSTVKNISALKTKENQLYTAVSSITDWTMKDRHNDQYPATVTLVRNQNVPAAELYTTPEKAEKKDGWIGTLLTVTLGGDKVSNEESHTTTEYIGVKCAELPEDVVTPEPKKYAILDQEDFEGWLKTNYAGVEFKQKQDLTTTPREEWVDGYFAIADTAHIAITAEVIKALYYGTYVQGGWTTIHFVEAVGIADDIEITNVEEVNGTYTLKCEVPDGVEWYNVELASTAVSTSIEADDDGNTTLAMGLNVLTADDQIITGAESCAVLYLTSAENKKVTFADDTNIVFIKQDAEDEGELNIEVDCELNTVLYAHKATIKLLPGAALKGNNVFTPANAGDVTIDNSILAEVNLGGTTETNQANVVVKATVDKFPSAIAANSNVTELTIEPAGNCEFNQTRANVLANLGEDATVTISATEERNIVVTSDVIMPANVKTLAGSDASNVIFKNNAIDFVTITMMNENPVVSEITITSGQVVFKDKDGNTIVVQ